VNGHPRKTQQARASGTAALCRPRAQVASRLGRREGDQDQRPAHQMGEVWCVGFATPPPPLSRSLICSQPPSLDLRHACSSLSDSLPLLAVELATDASGLRNPEVEVIKAPDARPPLPKIHRKVAEPVQPRQRSTRVRVSHWQDGASARQGCSSWSVAGSGSRLRRSGMTHFELRECRQTGCPG